MKTEKQINQLLARRAAEWMETLQAGDGKDQRDFVAWLRESRLHVDHYLAMELLDHRIRELGEDARPDIERILATSQANVVQLPQPPVDSRPTGFSSWRPWAAAAAIGVVVLGMVFALSNSGLLQSPFHVPGAGQVLATAIGEQRSLTLPDGSSVRINVDTALQIRFRDDVREIELTSGEATFRVARDTKRPFRVRTPLADVLALGTEFNVYARHDTVVSVVEGRVRVDERSGPISDSVFAGKPRSQELGAGEEAKVSKGVVTKRPADLSSAMAWQEGRINVEAMPLDEIVREFNRYGGPVHLTLEGISGDEYRFGGIFKATDAASFADVIEQQPDLSVERQPNEIVIRKRSAATRQ